MSDELDLKLESASLEQHGSCEKITVSKDDEKHVLVTKPVNNINVICLFAARQHKNNGVKESYEDKEATDDRKDMTDKPNNPPADFRDVNTHRTKVSLKNDRRKTPRPYLFQVSLCNRRNRLISSSRVSRHRHKMEIVADHVRDRLWKRHSSPVNRRAQINVAESQTANYVRRPVHRPLGDGNDRCVICNSSPLFKIPCSQHHKPASLIPRQINHTHDHKYYALPLHHRSHLGSIKNMKTMACENSVSRLFPEIKYNSIVARHSESLNNSH